MLRCGFFRFAGMPIFGKCRTSRPRRCHRNLHNPGTKLRGRLGRPPVLSYASYALDNWRRLDPTKPIQLDNIVLLQNFLGGLDEEWFVVVHIQIEREAGSGLAGLLRAMSGAAGDKEDEVLLGLNILGVGSNGDARHVDQDERALRSLRVLQPRAALHPRLEEQPHLTERARLRRRGILCRPAATISRRDRRAKLYCALPRRRTRNRPCA